MRLLVLLQLSVVLAGVEKILSKYTHSVLNSSPPLPSCHWQDAFVDFVLICIFGKICNEQVPHLLIIGVLAAKNLHCKMRLKLIRHISGLSLTNKKFFPVSHVKMIVNTNWEPTVFAKIPFNNQSQPKSEMKINGRK